MGTEPPTNGDMGSVRLAAVGDLHCPRTSDEDLRALLHNLSEEADLLLLCGDLVDYGKPEEARQLAAHLSAVRPMPVVAVLGNHEFECGQQDEIVRILSDQGVTVLDGTTVEYKGIGFAGVKGFCGGFGERTLQPWGETMLKQFVREAVEETLKLESALAKLRTASRVVLTHYAPIAETVQGEPAELFPFLGSSRLEEPLNRYGATAVFHGHAHHGTVEGRTLGGVPVYNVAFPLLRRRFPGRRAIRFVDVPTVSQPVSA
ncbi:MAG TPA: metallophosphoesterase [Nitrospira sp.]|nr:metallophosphoesterase [Nitrospira sp.]